MTNSDNAAADRNFQKNAMASFIQIGALVVLIVWCFQILSPFISVILWGMLIAVALYPVHALLAAKFGGREKTFSDCIRATRSCDFARAILDNGRFFNWRDEICR